MSTKLFFAGLMVGGCVLISCVTTGCKRVSISYHDHQPAHRHVWVSKYCRDCDGQCRYCRGCGRYRHRTVHVRIEDRHKHHWKLRWCDDCGAKCRSCKGCREIRHATVRVHIEKPAHRHEWVLKTCQQCRRECRFCSGCRKVVHTVVKYAPSMKRRSQSSPRR